MNGTSTILAPPPSCRTGRHDSRLIRVHPPVQTSGETGKPALLLVKLKVWAEDRLDIIRHRPITPTAITRTAPVAPICTRSEIQAAMCESVAPIEGVFVGCGRNQRLRSRGWI